MIVLKPMGKKIFKIIQKKFSPKIIIVDDIDRDFGLKITQKNIIKLHMLLEMLE